METFTPENNSGLEKAKNSLNTETNLPIDLRLSPTDIEISTNNAFKLPFDQFPALGTAFASLPEQFQTITSTASGLTGFIPVDKFGTPLDPSILFNAHNGVGVVGSFMEQNGNLNVARWVELNGPQTAATTIPYNPALLFMAVALAQVNQKLDAIQETQEEMFEYLKQKDKAALRGNIQTLNNVLLNYKFNWDNELYIKNTHMKILDVIQETDKQIVHLRAQIKSKMEDKKFLQSRISVNRQINDLLNLLKDYQLANYAYSYASFVEPMLSKNFKEDYLTLTENRLSEYSIKFRELYSECYSIIEKNLSDSIDKNILKGVSFASKKLGSAVAKTPLGKASPLDEALLKASDEVQDFNEDQSTGMLKKLQAAKDPNVAVFQQTISKLNQLHNTPMQLAADKDNLYVIPQIA